MRAYIIQWINKRDHGTSMIFARTAGAAVEELRAREGNNTVAITVTPKLQK
jgi:hypothetical protein